MNVFDKFRDPELTKGLLSKIEEEIQGEVRFMEVCGTHTVAIFQSGLNSLLPGEVVHLSGPGCPVCVTHDREVATYLDLAARGDAILATFGDLMKVPGPGGVSLKTAQAEGARVRIVYSPFDALKLARENPSETVVFIGIGFETTAPTVAATLKMAESAGVENFKVLSFHKLVPPALKALGSDPELMVRALILPGHVSTIIGLDPYRFLAEEHGMPAVITGFDPLDILQALLEIIRQLNSGQPKAVNLYTRAVKDSGNPKAAAMMREVFTPGDGLWRGIGVIPESGLFLSDKFARFDAFKALGLELAEAKSIPGCRCGDVLKGKTPPDKCPLFGKKCTPAAPVGPCMVSTEGSCAAYYKYKLD